MPSQVCAITSLLFMKKNNKSGAAIFLPYFARGESNCQRFLAFKKTSDFLLDKITKWCILNIQRIMQFV